VDDEMLEWMEKDNVIQIILHVIFCTKDRKPRISAAFRHRFYDYLTTGRHELGQVMCVDGTENHIHALVLMNPVNTVAGTITKLKRLSAKWINQEIKPSPLFRWHGGYAAFGVSPWLCGKEMAFIARQRRLHQRVTLEKEYMTLLDRQGIEYDPATLWD
jgi:putative transposase